MQNIVLCENVDNTMFMHISDYFKTQKMCDKVVEKDSLFVVVAGYFKTQEMCDKVVEKDSLFVVVAGYFKTQEMREKIFVCNNTDFWSG